MKRKENVLPFSYEEVSTNLINAVEEDTSMNVKFGPADVQCMQRMSCVNLCWRITSELWTLILVTLMLITITQNLLHAPLCATLQKLVPSFGGNVVEFEQKVNFGATFAG